MLKRGYCYNQCLLNAVWTRVKDNNNMIGCTEVVSVSASCSRCSIIYSVEILLYSLHFTIYRLPLLSSRVFA